MAEKDVQVYNGNGERLEIEQCCSDATTLAVQRVARVHGILRDGFNTSVSLRDAVRFFKLWGYIRWEYRQRKDPNPGTPCASDHSTDKDVR